jgi:hypothetical protein
LSNHSAVSVHERKVKHFTVVEVEDVRVELTDKFIQFIEVGKFNDVLE